MRTSQLTDLYTATGPFASVTLDVGHGTESGAHEHELRVRAACDELAGAGADDDVVRRVGEVLAEPTHEPAPVARTIVASAEGVHFDETWPGRVDRTSATWGPLPDLGPWIEHQDGTTRFVLALVDHEGGDVAVYTSDVPEPDEEVEAGGETQHVHKVPTGGWSALRYQRTTENVWKQNAQAVAEEIRSAVRSGPRLVLVAGDPTSRTLVLDELEGLQAEVVPLERGGRADDGGDEAHQQAVREALMEHVVARRLELVRTLAERTGQGQAAAVGVDEVADAFVRGQVDTLLLDVQAADEVTLDPTAHPGLSLGAVDVRSEVAAGPALVAAAALTGADVAVGPARALGGEPVAALLRWDQG